MFLQQTLKRLLKFYNLVLKEKKDSVYIRLTGGANNPIVYNSDYKFVLGKAIELTEGGDVTIFSSGSMVYQSLQASKLLKDKKINAKVINMHTIKPIDQNALKGY